MAGYTGKQYGPNVRRNALDISQYQVVKDNVSLDTLYPFSNKSAFDNLPDDQLDAVIDQNWVQKAFLTGDVFMPTQQDASNRYYSLAELKFTNSTIGGNFGINARPQFTPYADIRVPGRYPGVVQKMTVNAKGINGMGRYYSEAIDDNSEIIYIRFGVPAFNSLLNFFNNFYNPEDAMLANTGRISTIYLITKTITSIAFFVYFPPLAVLIYGDKMLKAFFGSKPNQYYYLKPTMHTYWGAVNTLLNVISTNLNLLPPLLTNTTGTTNQAQYIGTPYKVPSQVLNALHKEMPEVFNSEYGIDAYALANKAQRMANLAFQHQYNSFNKLTNAQKLKGISNNVPTVQGQPNLYNTSVQDVTDVIGAVGNSINSLGADISGAYGDVTSFLGKSNTSIKSYLTKKPRHGFIDYAKLVKNTKYYQGKVQNSKTAGMPPSELIPLVDESGNSQTYKKAHKAIDGLGSMLEAEWDDGAAFATFRVNFVGSGSLSYTASVGQPGIAQKYNSYASNMRSYKFDTEDYHLGLTDGIMSKLVSSAKDALNGVASGFHIDGLVNALLGNVKVEVPDYWEDSSVNFPVGNYEMELVSPYGNVISQIQNIYLPLSMIMAGSLPLATGRTSYTSPFICQLFDRGHNQIGLGMIDSVNIDYGTTNLPFTRWGRPLGVNVSFSIANLSKFMAMPLVAGTLYGVGNTFFDNMNQDNPISNFLAIITGRDIYSQIYAIPRAQINLAAAIKQVDVFTSNAYWGSYTHQLFTTGALSWTLIPNLIGTLNNGLATPVQANDTNGPNQSTNPG